MEKLEMTTEIIHQVPADVTDKINEIVRWINNFQKESKDTWEYRSGGIIQKLRNRYSFKELLTK